MDKRILMAAFAAVLAVAAIAFLMMPPPEECDACKVDPNQTCVLRDGQCCKGGACAAAFPNCLAGTSASCKGCTPDCTPECTCEPTGDRKTSCAQDSDCACGVDKVTGDCLRGNKAFVDTARQCPDFCTGIAGHILTKCVNSTCTGINTLGCRRTPDPGPCEAYMPRYYFNSTEGACKEFIWGGCQGVVPFETLEACKLACE